jgi:hypothetical protein
LSTFYAITKMMYDDESAMMADMDANVLDLQAIPGLNSVKAVKVADATTAADGITCTGTTPTQEADCPTGCTFAAAEAASCGGEATDTSATPDCSALTADTACTDAGCALTPSSDASCGADVDAVLASEGTVVLVAAYEDAAAAIAAADTVTEMLATLATFAVAAPERVLGSVIWNQPNTPEAFPPLCDAPVYTRPPPPSEDEDEVDPTKTSSSAGMGFALSMLVTVLLAHI